MPLIYRGDFTPPNKLDKEPNTLLLLPPDESQGITVKDAAGGRAAWISGGAWVDAAHLARIAKELTET